MKPFIKRILHEVIRRRIIKRIVITVIIEIFKEWTQYSDNYLTETRVSEISDWLTGTKRTKADKANKQPLNSVHRVK